MRGLDIKKKETEGRRKVKDKRIEEKEMEKKKR